MRVGTSLYSRLFQSAILLAATSVATLMIQPAAEAQTTSWAACAKENQTCSFTGTRKVRFGADSRWVTRDITATGGGVACTTAVFGDPAKGAAKSCQIQSGTASAAAVPSGWTFCANENVKCSFTGTRRVRYGVDTRWITRDITASNGGISCSNATFGDPARGVWKSCQLQNTSSGGTNLPPVISGSPSTSITVGSSYWFQPAASDPNGSALTFSILNKPTWATFNTTNGRITGNPTLANVGTYANITIRVSDGASTVSLRAFTITVATLSSGSVTLSWTPPVSNTNGSVLTNLAGYRIVYGTSATALNQQIQITNASVSSYVISGLTRGTYYFAVRAYTSTGVQSDLSNVASKTIS